MIACAEKPIVKWAKSAFGASDNGSQSITSDTKGNVYVTGYFIKSMTFGSKNITTKNACTWNVFIAKYNPLGNIVWVRSAGGNDSDYGIAIAVDKQENIYLAGIYRSSSISFGSYNLINNDNYGKSFIVKYDSCGNVLWAKNVAKSSSSIGIFSICTDKEGNIYATGHFQDHSINFGKHNLINDNALNQDAFIAKFDTQGNSLWIKSFGGIYNDVGSAISVDTTGNIYVAGYFESPTIIFDSITISNNNVNHPTRDIYIVKYTKSGKLAWVRSVGGNNTDEVTTMKVDNSGNVYLGGYFKSNSINFGSITLTNTNQVYIKDFIAKYDTNGNALWAKSGGNTTKNDAINSISTDKYGNVYSTGYFESPFITFDTVRLTNKGSFSQDLFVTKQNPSGNVMWAEDFGGAGNDSGKSIATDTNGYVYLTGQFSSPSLSFDSKTLNNSTGLNELFVVKLFSNSRHVKHRVLPTITNKGLIKDYYLPR